MECEPPGRLVSYASTTNDMVDYAQGAARCPIRDPLNHQIIYAKRSLQKSINSDDITNVNHFNTDDIGVSCNDSNRNISFNHWVKRLVLVKSIGWTLTIILYSNPLLRKVNNNVDSTE